MFSNVLDNRRKMRAKWRKKLMRRLKRKRRNMRTPDYSNY